MTIDLFFYVSLLNFEIILFQRAQRKRRMPRFLLFRLLVSLSLRRRYSYSPHRSEIGRLAVGFVYVAVVRRDGRSHYFIEFLLAPTKTGSWPLVNGHAEVCVADQGQTKR